jgi:hypothetical protein
MIHIDFNNLAYKHAFDFIPSQDPDVSLRVALPVPNWLRKDGRPMRKFKHPDLIFNEGKGQWRFRFVNDKDGGREQQAKVDGSGVIMIGGMTTSLYKELVRHIMLTKGGMTKLTAKDLNEILNWARRALRAGDFYNSNAGDIETRFWCWGRTNPKSIFGGWVPKPHVSCAVGYKGAVTFNILASGKQVYYHGGYVTFPTLSADQVKAAGKKGIEALCAEKDVIPRAVAADVFRRQNSLIDGSPIPLPTLHPRQRPAMR